MLENQIHITFHETGGGTENEFFQSAGEIATVVDAAVLPEQRPQGLRANRFQRKVEFHLVDALFESN
jgi:hypothetical protein